MILAWIQAQAVKLLGGAALVLLLALCASLWRSDSLSKQRDDAIEAKIVEQAKHAVTAASLNTLTAELARMVAEGEAKAERVQKAYAVTRKETADLRKQADDLEDGRITIAEVEGI